MNKTVIAAILLIQMLYAVCAAQNAPLPEKPPPAVMILWGVTLGTAPPQWPKCSGSHGDAAERDPACIGSFGAVYNLIPNEIHAQRTVDLTLDEDGRVQKFFTDFSIYVCDDVLQAFNAKFGKPVHQVVPMQNGYGARWNGDMYTWRTGNGSELVLSVSVAEMRSCDLDAETVDVVRKRSTRAVPTP
ncbi:MAG: hypothetical protein WAL71_07850 [Terriglobales bacterium]|jgi:hypothetical protein